MLTIPFALREKYSLLDGGMALLIEQPDGLLIKKLEPQFFDSFLGKYADEMPTASELQTWSNEEITTDETRTKALP